MSDIYKLSLLNTKQQKITTQDTKWNTVTYIHKYDLSLNNDVLKQKDGQ